MKCMLCARTALFLFLARVRLGRRLRRAVSSTLLLTMLGCRFGFPQTTNSPVDRNATYYVDSISGNDVNSGTSQQKAWKTLGKVNAMTFSPGDHILFKSGEKWSGQLWPKGSGTKQHPIVIDKYGGEMNPIINGGGEAEDAVLLKNQEYWEINNLEVTNTGPTPRVRR